MFIDTIISKYVSIVHTPYNNAECALYAIEYMKRSISLIVLCSIING